VPEPDIFVQTHAVKKQGSQRPSIWAIFSLPLLPRTVLASLLCTGMQGGYYAMFTWLPTLLKLERHLTVLDTGAYLMVIIVGSFCGYLVGAFLADYLGRRRNFMLFALLSLASVCLYLNLPLSNTQMLWLGFPLGFASCGIFSGIGAYLTELYPSELRATGQSFTYNFGRGIGALFPGLVGVLSHFTSLSTGIVIFSGTAYAVVFLTVFLLPETKGAKL
jgi:predicted MFS family arabinose efflux permease